MSSDVGRSFFVSGGTLPADSASYIERSTDVALMESLLAKRYCYVLNSRQLGKSSLSVHAISRLRALGIRTAFIDLTRIGGQNVTPEQWYSGIALEIGRVLNCRREVVAYWKENASVALVQRLFGMILDVVLTQAASTAPLVIFIDEIDATRSLPFDADEFFAAIRECYNRRVSEPVFERLTFCLLGVAVPSDLVRNRAMTPFNIGERIALEDFRLDEISAFAPELGPNGKEVVARVHYWTGGHPFLSQSLCRSIEALGGVENNQAVDVVVRRELFDFKARNSNINLADVANIALHYGETEEARADLLSLYERVLAGRDVIDDESNRSVVVLKLSGIVRSDGRRLYVRNRIYERVFDRKWIQEHMPEQELRRQRQSFRRGAWRTALVAGSILAAVGVGAAVIWYSRIEALNAKASLSYQLYVADMNSLRLFYDNGDSGRIETILNRHRNSPYRGFEWGYWLGRYHDAPEEYTLDYKAPGKKVEGQISTDGREVCIIDILSLTATVVERASKRVVATSRISLPGWVVPLGSRWAEIRETSRFHYRVADLKTGQTVSALGDAGNVTQWVMPFPHSDFVATGEGVSPDKPLVVSIWNAETGKKVFSMPAPWKDVYPNPGTTRGPLNLSIDGRYAVYQRGPFGPVAGDRDGARHAEVVVLDLTTRKVIDRFPVTSFCLVATRGIDGKTLFLIDRERCFVRDVRAHRSVDWRTDLLPEWHPVDGVVSGDSLVALMNGGRCVVQDLTGKSRDVLRENVSSIAPGAVGGQYLASSSSVRIYDPGSLANAAVIGAGNRVTRYSKGVLNLFRSGVTGIARVDEMAFDVMGTVPLVGDGGAYTYGGRWYLVRGDGSGPDVLKDGEGKVPPISLPLKPIIWSCGRNADSIALWRFDSKEIVRYSGTDRRVRWTRSELDGVTALWVSPDGSRLFVALSERKLVVLDMANGHTLGEINAHNMGPVYLTFSADGRRVFTCGGDGSAAMWDLNHLTKLMSFRGNDQDGMTSADLSPDGRRVVTTTRSGSWQLWDASNGVQLLDVHASAAPLSSAVFGSNGLEIVTAGEDRKVRVWRSANIDPTTYAPIEDSYLSNLHDKSLRTSNQ